jgi:DNA-directed RNA polymerase subunit alpha
MESIIDCQINLFAEKLPEMTEIKKLSEFVNSSERNMRDFNEQLQANLSKESPQSQLAAGIGLFIIGKTTDAIERLKKGKDCREKSLYLAFAQRKLRNFDEAIKNLDQSLKQGADALFVNLEKTATFRQSGNYESAQKQLESCANFKNVSSEYHYQAGRLNEAQGLYGQAVENFKKAIELSPNHQKALFHLAYRCDLSGDEEAAIDYYKQITKISPVFTSALLNLAVLYEDSEQYERSLQCVNKVLKYHPNHPRALLFKKDIESSQTMIYDEEKEKKKDRKQQILETPISDFELSVRSRNCLRKMKINTIGDLLNITESKLLSYKNFGETSLREIKAILESKGMHLGMAFDEKKFSPIETNSQISEENEGLLSKSIDDLQLSVRSKKCIEKLNLHTIGELVQKTEAELLGCKNFGVTSLNEITKALDGIGLSLRSLD